MFPAVFCMLTMTPSEKFSKRGLTGTAVPCIMRTVIPESMFQNVGSALVHSLLLKEQLRFIPLIFLKEQLRPVSLTYLTARRLMFHDKTVYGRSIFHSQEVDAS